ncbi:nitrosoguanidine resistance protein, putative [Candida dubliniensis CD36]|uniref:Nitrosoguanidine resistance protein, putative n=1 Tax=Candida dubliniensis (strain CD36 / ATCC MYA-646 / CBS 7987 / NCPF 3949 / NRRL Y-17841) TaxID=573826 RepID=B9WDZ6_CANDC|nr:nitrosoguanidine resistance protein, putative [Candida dubliniensis CD36]CAX42906.1 nitrosoguanidine resistance protein, putative [Candida dubliniensis CD36]
MNTKMLESEENSQDETYLGPQQQQQQQYYHHKYLSSSELEPSPPARNMVGKVNKGLSLFSKKFQTERKKIALKYFLNYLIMGIGVLGIFSIYWGSFYRINGRIKNLKMLVVIEDDSIINGLNPVFGDNLKEILQTPEAKTRGNWKIYNSTEFAQIALKSNRTAEEEIMHQIHHQEYWASLHVLPNASYNYFNALSHGDTNYDIVKNTVHSIYETGRDFNGMTQFVIPSISNVENVWLSKQSTMAFDIVGNLTINSTEKLKLLAQPIKFEIVDPVPWNDPILIGPFHDLLIYMTILTLLQFEFFSPVHKAVSKLGIRKRHYMIYRFTASILSFLVLSLFCCLVTLAFQVDLTVTYGKAGFVVYWMIAFMTMWALGSVNEIMAMLLIIVYPPLVQFWLLFWIIANITPTFTPMAVLPKFFRYGYALPIHNSYEATKTVFFGTYKGQLGRNFGILAAWFAVLSFIFPFVVYYFITTTNRNFEQQVCAAVNEKKELETEEHHH